MLAGPGGAPTATKVGAPFSRLATGTPRRLLLSSRLECASRSEPLWLGRTRPPKATRVSGRNRRASARAGPSLAKLSRAQKHRPPTCSSRQLQGPLRMGAPRHTHQWPARSRSIRLAPAGRRTRVCGARKLNKCARRECRQAHGCAYARARAPKFQTLASFPLVHVSCLLFQLIPLLPAQTSARPTCVS